jgi:hypothetical protein
MLRGRGQANRLAVFEMDVDAAAGRAESADHSRDLLGRETARQPPQPELRRLLDELAAQWTIAVNHHGVSLACTLRTAFHRIAPGMRDAGAARKNK